MKVGFGILSWDGTERRSNRYGSIALGSRPFQGAVYVKHFADSKVLHEHIGKRVQLTVKIVESRVGTHAGDAGLKIKPPPTAPEVGQIIDLGVGVLGFSVETWGADQVPILTLQPGDGRDELWLDPRKLYILHDQTVEVYIEETSADFTPAPVIECDTGAFDNGDGYSFQVKKRGAGHIPAKIEKLGGGMFIIEPPTSVPGQFGRKLPYKED